MRESFLCESFLRESLSEEAACGAVHAAGLTCEPCVAGLASAGAVAATTERPSAAPVRVTVVKTRDEADGAR